MWENPKKRQRNDVRVTNTNLAPPVPQKLYGGGEILRMKMGQKIECECGKCRVDRVGDNYDIRGPMYHTKDSASEWLVCPECKDRIKIHPVINWDGVETKGWDDGNR